MTALLSLLMMFFAAFGAVARCSRYAPPRRPTVVHPKRMDMSAVTATDVVHAVLYTLPGLVLLALVAVLRALGRRAAAYEGAPRWARRYYRFSAALLFRVGAGLLAVGGAVGAGAAAPLVHLGQAELERAAQAGDVDAAEAGLGVVLVEQVADREQHARVVALAERDERRGRRQVELLVGGQRVRGAAVDEDVAGAEAPRSPTPRQVASKVRCGCGTVARRPIMPQTAGTSAGGTSGPMSVARRLGWFRNFCTLKRP